MRRIAVAIVFIAREGKYYLQLRGSDPYKGAAGLIGGFGGKIEPGETAVQAAKRELEEETSLRISPQRLKELGDATVISDYQLQPTEVHLTAFLLRLKSSETFVATEGSIVELTKAEAIAKGEAITPGTLACFKKVVKE